MMLPLHEYCALFAPLTTAQMNELIKDIKANGLRHPIVTYKGTVLDGQNRQHACAQSAITPTYVEFDGDDNAALAYVISANLSRRHIPAKARAAIAAKICTIRPGYYDAAKTPGVTLNQAAAMVGVSRRSVQRAARLTKAPRIVKAVADGRLTQAQGEEALRLPADILASLPNKGWEPLLLAQIEKNKTRKPMDPTEAYVGKITDLPDKPPEKHSVVLAVQKLFDTRSPDWFGPDQAMIETMEVLIEWAKEHPE